MTFDSAGLNSTASLNESHDTFFGDGSDRFRGRLPSHLSSSGLGTNQVDGIKPINALFSSNDDQDAS